MKETDDKLDVKAAVDEHENCMHAVAEVEFCLDRQPDREGRWLADLAGKLPGLLQTLATHFEFEQDSDLYRKVPVRYPHFSARLDRLAGEHDVILEETRAAMDHAGRVGSANIHELRELNARVQVLVARIRRHEAEENEIAFGALWDDVGAGD